MPPTLSHGKDAGNSDVAFEDSAKLVPLDPQTTFSPEQLRYIRDAIGTHTSSVEQRLNEKMAQLQDAVSYNANATSSLEYRLDEAVFMIMSKLNSMAVSSKDPFNNLGPQDGGIHNGIQRTLSNASIMKPSQAPVQGITKTHHICNTTEHGTFTKQERYSTLQIPEQQDHYRDDYRRSPSPYPHSNTLPSYPSSTSVRWRPEDLGYFHGQKDDVHTWVDRIRELAALKAPTWSRPIYRYRCAMKLKTGIIMSSPRINKMSS